MTPLVAAALLGALGAIGAAAADDRRVRAFCSAVALGGLAVLAALATAVPSPAIPVAPLAIPEAGDPEILPSVHPDDALVLPYEDRRGRLIVDVGWVERGRTVETTMMLDTGATVTTLSTDALERLGVELRDDAPKVTVHTANGDAESKFVLVDRLWIGDLAVDDVAVTICDACADLGVDGLLGLNVTAAFDLHIDQVRREISLTPRSDAIRTDVERFVDLRTRRVGAELFATVTNLSRRELHDVVIAVRCDDALVATLTIASVPAGELGAGDTRLPPDACDEPRLRVEGGSFGPH